ncbi:MAG: hypothetical protein RL215_1169 [Planctomycetota bacterium]
MVEITAGFLSTLDIDAPGEIVFTDVDGLWRFRAVEETVDDFESFGFADSFFGTEPDTTGLEAVLDCLDDDFAVVVECEAGELNEEPAAVVIDGESGEEVCFAEDESAAGGGQSEVKEAFAEVNGILDE